MKRIICAVLIPLLLICMIIPTGAETENNSAAVDLSLNCVSAVLMEAETGKILYEMNPDEALPPASVTKIMTLLLVMEAIEGGVLKLDDILSCSANAASMGGSQVYMKEGEQMSVEELIKCVVICSANDAAVVLAEAVAGSEDAFVDKMNKRARELEMKSTHFENTNGLDDTVTNHVTSAKDIAIMSRELIKHEKILEYSSTWMDTIRNGAFGLTNTNRLVRFYKGATGLKTGSTSKAKFCMSATAKRDGMHLICVIMGAETRDIRNAAATALLDWGFAGYALYVSEEGESGTIKVTGGIDDKIGLVSRRFCCVVPKGNENKIEKSIEIDESTAAPVRVGERVGVIKYTCAGEVIGESDIVTADEMPKISFWQVFGRIFSCFLIA